MPKDKCQPIRDNIDAVERNIQDLEDFLPEAPPPLRPRIRAQIKREKQVLARLKKQLRDCERGQ